MMQWWWWLDGKSGDLGEHRQHEENLYLEEGSRQQKVLYLNVNCKLKKVTHEEVRRAGVLKAPQAFSNCCDEKFRNFKQLNGAVKPPKSAAQRFRAGWDYNRFCTLYFACEPCSRPVLDSNPTLFFYQ